MCLSRQDTSLLKECNRTRKRLLKTLEKSEKILISLKIKADETRR